MGHTLLKRCFQLFLISFFLCSSCSDKSLPRDEARLKNTLIVALKSTPGIDPHLYNVSENEEMLTNIGEGLLTLDAKDNSVRPGIAEKWEVSKDQKKYRFYLRKNAVFENGLSIQAQDFANTYQRLLDPKTASMNAFFLFSIKNAKEFNSGKIENFSQVGIQVVSPWILDITLEHPFGSFLNVLCHPHLVVVESSLLRKYPHQAIPQNEWIASGPFKISKFREQVEVILEKRANYWDPLSRPDSGTIQKVKFHIVESYDTDDKLYRVGALHVSMGISFTRFEALKTEIPNELKSESIASTYFFIFNFRNPLLKNLDLRRALILGLDRKTVIRRANPVHPEIAFGFIPPMLGGIPQQEYRFDLLRAKELYKKIPSIKKPLNFITNSVTQNKSLFEAVQAQWQSNLRFPTQIETREGAAMSADLQAGNFDIIMRIWFADFLDPLTFLGLFESTSPDNRGKYSNPTFDALLNEARLAKTPKARAVAFEKAEAALAEDPPGIPMFFLKRTFRVRPEVEGYYVTPLNLHPLKYVRFKN